MLRERINISVKKTFNSLVICGLLCNLLVGIVAINDHDHVLLTFCASLAIASLGGRVLVKMEKPTFAMHLVLMSYLIVFIVASFTHIIYYSLLLVYPILIGFANFFLRKEKAKNIYIIISFVGCFVTIINTHLFIWGELNIYQLLGHLIVAIGLLVAFIFTIKVQSKKINNYREQREEVEKSVVEKNQALKEYIKTNLQLENFAHLASHDLKTPIKNISNFSQLLDKRLGSKLDPKEQEILNLIKEESQRMSKMMADLLRLSQLAKKKIGFRKINGHKFINRLIEENFSHIDGFIGVNSFPMEMVAAESHLHLLFYNLIENAIKFSSTNQTPKITIYGRRSMEYYYFEVKDNGLGIDDKYKKSVFLIFNKLNPQFDTEASGIGLSICREIVQRHNGRIWIEDNIGGGSIIKFTIRRNLESDLSESVLNDDINPLEVQIA